MTVVFMLKCSFYFANQTSLTGIYSTLLCLPAEITEQLRDSSESLGSLNCFFTETNATTYIKLDMSELFSTVIQSMYPQCLKKFLDMIGVILLTCKPS